MRRKGQPPFTRHALGSKSPKQQQQLNDHALSNEDYVYKTMQRELADGMNHITKSILQTRVGISDSGDTISCATGELQTLRENIPMRPLMLNGSGATVANGTNKRPIME